MSERLEQREEGEERAQTEMNRKEKKRKPQAFNRCNAPATYSMCASPFKTRTNVKRINTR